MGLRVIAVWLLGAAATVWAVGQLVAAWRDRRRPVRGADGRWRTPAPTGNGYGPRRHR